MMSKTVQAAIIGAVVTVVLDHYLRTVRARNGA